jgi:hypothetical protein
MVLLLGEERYSQQSWADFLCEHARAQQFQAFHMVCLFASNQSS